MTETQSFVEISSRSAAELAEKYIALWNEPVATGAGTTSPTCAPCSKKAERELGRTVPRGSEVAEQVPVGLQRERRSTGSQQARP
jgi:hypothetical protein